MIRGRVGDTTYYVSMERQIARQALNGSNYGESARRSEAQQNRRVRWSCLVNFYKLSKFWMPKAFETKKKGQSDYNRFMSVNLGKAVIAFTRDEALQGAVVVHDFVVSQGSIPSIDITQSGGKWLTNLSLGALNIDANTTVGEFSDALVAANESVQMGMQLSFVSYQQLTTSAGIPQCTCGFYEVTLDSADSTPLRDYLPEFCSTTTNGKLSTSTSISVGAFTYILSDERSGAVRVSSQTLINNNASLVAAYSSASQYAKAVDSYGVDTDVVLSPNTINAQEPIAQPTSLNSVQIVGSPTKYVPGDYLGVGSPILDETGIILNMSGLGSLAVTAVRVQTLDQEVQNGNAAFAQIAGNNITLPPSVWEGGSWMVSPVILLSVTLSNGSTYSIVFADSEVHD